MGKSISSTSQGLTKLLWDSENPSKSPSHSTCNSIKYQSDM